MKMNSKDRKLLERLSAKYGKNGVMKSVLGNRLNESGDEDIEKPAWLDALCDEFGLSDDFYMSRNGGEVEVELEWYTEIGQDMAVTATWTEGGDDAETAVEAADSIYRYAESWDSEEEADLWCEEEDEYDEENDEYVTVKHGTNGAPYDYEDIVADMDEAHDTMVKMADFLYAWADGEPLKESYDAYDEDEDDETPERYMIIYDGDYDNIGFGSFNLNAVINVAMREYEEGGYCTIEIVDNETGDVVWTTDDEEGY